MLRKRSRPVTSSSSSSKNTNTNPTPAAAPDHHNHNTTENNSTNFLSPTSHLPPSESKKSIKLLPTSLFFFNSSKLFSNFFFTNSNSISAETEPQIMNHLPQTSRFDTQKPLFAPPPSPLGAAPPIFNDNKQLKMSSANTKHKQTHHHFWEKSNAEKGVGLVALIDETLNNNNNNNHNNNNNSSSSSSNSSKQQQKTKLVVFGSQLKIQIPPCLPQFHPSTPSPTTTTTTTTPSSCCNSPGEFGIKTPRSNLFTNSRQQQQQQQQQKNLLDDEELVRADSISIEDIELSEDYTCVITHGPNPRTTRIFGNSILEDCCGENGSGLCSRKKEEDEEMGFPNWEEEVKMMEVEEKKVEAVESFLSFCHYCKKKIGEGNDIYMYRGEKAFCSQECRCQGMLFEEVEA